MNRVLPLLLGPELYWALTCLFLRLVTRRALAPDPSITAQLDRYWAVLPLVVVPLAFAFFIPSHGRWWLLARIDLACVIGLAVATTQYCNAMTYHEPSSGPGAGTAWMMMLGLGYSVLVLGSVIAASILWWRGRVPA